jgi:hypothetical protein
MLETDGPPTAGGWTGKANVKAKSRRQEDRRLHTLTGLPSRTAQLRYRSKAGRTGSPASVLRPAVNGNRPGCRSNFCYILVEEYVQQQARDANTFSRCTADPLMGPL